MATLMIRALTPLPAAPRAGLGRCFQRRSAISWEVARALSPRVSRACGWLLVFVSLFAGARAARAELPELVRPSQPVGPAGLDGGRHVGSALPPARSLRLASSLGYAYTGDVLADGDRHQRFAGELYGALVLHSALQLSLGCELRGDRHHTDTDGADKGLLGSTRLTTRHALRVHPRLAIAAQPSVLFPGASSVRRGLRASTFDLNALASVELSPAAQLGLSLGYRVDGSPHVVEDPLALSRSDLLAASISDHDAYLLGALFSHDFAPFTTLLEWSWEIATGGPTRSLESPMRVRAAVQRLVGERFLPGVELGLDTSSRPAFEGLVRIEPRLWARLNFSVLLDRLPAKPKAVSPPRTAPRPVAAKTTTIVLVVVNEAGEPLAGARVAVARDEGAQGGSCDDTGRVQLELPRGVTTVSIEAEGYEPQWQTVTVGPGAPQRVALTRDLPPAELKGAVRSLSGGTPLRAHVEVVELGKVVETEADGQFVIGVAPGHYTLRISADGHETQERAVHVELRGVTILVIDLRRASK